MGIGKRRDLREGERQRERKDREGRIRLEYVPLTDLATPGT